MCPILLKFMKKIISYTTIRTKHRCTFKGTSLISCLFFTSGQFVKIVPQVTTGQNGTPLCNSLDGLVTMRWLPLQTLLDKHAFDRTLHDLIPIDDEFKSMEELVLPLKIITDCIKKLMETDEPTIQNAFTFIIQLCRLAKLKGAKFAHNNNFLYNITVTYTLKHVLTYWFI